MDKVVHFDMPVDDVEKTKEFYSKVFGWNFVDVPNMNYTMAHTGPTSQDGMNQEPGFINGGIYKRDDRSAKVPIIVIDVASVDDYVKKVQEAGGKVFKEKVQVGDMGFYAQVEDTEGNVVGIWENIKKEN